jgi:hypothetical protein
MSTIEILDSDDTLEQMVGEELIEKFGIEKFLVLFKKGDDYKSIHNCDKVFDYWLVLGRMLYDDFEHQKQKQILDLLFEALGIKFHEN